MSFVSIAHGFMYPNFNVPAGADQSFVGLTLDAATEKVAFIGHCYINGRPGSAKTISSSGGKIHISMGAVTWANSSSRFTVGIQDIATGSGPSATPDGSFDVSDELVQGTDTITGSELLTVTMSSGTKDITHGDLIAVVMDMNARGGADSLVVNGLLRSSNATRPMIRHFTSSAWGNPQAVAPSVTIEFDDGTLGTINNAFPVITAVGAAAWTNATNPDERGISFQMPWDCKIDAFCGWITVDGSTADFTWTLYSDPFGTPAAVSGAQLTVLAEQMGFSTINDTFFMLPAEVTLTRGTDYVLAVKVTGAGNVTWRPFTLADAAHRVLLPGYAGSPVAHVTRNNDAGAFSATTTLIPRMGVMVSAVHDTSGGGSSAVLGAPNLRGNFQ